MVIDAFPINYEIDLALFRIQYLGSVVDKFVIGEAALTHTGIPKERLFRNYMEENHKKFDNVEILNISLSEEASDWENEISTREQIKKFVFDQYPNDYFILSDLDEIPSINQVKALVSDMETYHFLTPTYYGFANLKILDPKHQLWKRGVMGHTSLPLGKNAGRFENLPTLSCKEDGAHFSWLQINGLDLQKKLVSTPHSELRIQDISSQELFRFAMYYHVDHLGRFDMPGNGLLECLPSDKFNHVQVKLFEFNPKVFCVDPKQHSRMIRLFASLIVTSIYHFPGFRSNLFSTFILKKYTVARIVRSFFVLSYFFFLVQIKKFIRKLRSMKRSAYFYLIFITCHIAFATMLPSLSRLFFYN